MMLGEKCYWQLGLSVLNYSFFDFMQTQTRAAGTDCLQKAESLLSALHFVLCG